MSDHNGKSTALSVNANPIHNPKEGHEMSVRNNLEDSPDSTEDMIGGRIGRDKMEMMEIDDIEMPDMWAKENVGLYCQYMAVGLLYGSAGTVLPFCAYVKNGEDQVCSNAPSLVFLAWNFKILFAIMTDMWRPWGYRRKVWMALGWGLALVILFFLAVIPTEKLSVSAWLGLLMLTQCFVMLADVPADGYCVQLGQMEPPSQRGQILATGQLLRFFFSMIAGFIQTFFLNSSKTAPPGSTDVWSWGLSMNGYYTLMFVLVVLLCWPILYMKELESVSAKSDMADSFCAMRDDKGAAGGASASASDAELAKAKKLRPKVFAQTPTHVAGPSKSAGHDEAPTWAFFKREVWKILQNQTTLYLLIYVIGFHTLAGVRNISNTYLQYYVIQLTQMQAGIDAMTSYLALVAAIWIFKNFMLGVNWRYTQWFSCTISLLFGLLWIPAYHPQSGVMNAWYTIFIDLDSSFISGLAQVLYSLSVIELAQPGLEATTYELIVTVGNACLTVSTIVGTQLLVPVNAIGCQLVDYTQCSADSVNIKSIPGFVATDGPSRYTDYTWLIFGVNIVNASIWVWFLPRSIAHCAEWKAEGIAKGNSQIRGFIAMGMCLVMVAYGFICALLLLDPKTSCLKLVGGMGCSAS